MTYRRNENDARRYSNETTYDRYRSTLRTIVSNARSWRFLDDPTIVVNRSVDESNDFVVVDFYDILDERFDEIRRDFDDEIVRIGGVRFEYVFDAERWAIVVDDIDGDWISYFEFDESITIDAPIDVIESNFYSFVGIARNVLDRSFVRGAHESNTGSMTYSKSYERY